MKLERVGRVTVGHLGLKVGGQVNDGDGFKGAPMKQTGQSELGADGEEKSALLGTDTTSDTELLRDESNLLGTVDLDTELACSAVGI